MFAVPALAVTAAMILYYFQQSSAAGRWLGGGSLAGLLCGVGAGSIILFEMLLWPRKLFRKLRLVPAKYWMAAHIWFGLAALPLAVVHCGFHLGGWLPTTFMILFVLTIVSGLYGLAVQNILPRWMLRNLPRETIYNQMDYISEQTVEDARRLLVNVCGARSVSSTLDEEPELQTSGPVVVGAVRQAGKTRGRTLETRHIGEAREDRESLWTAFEEIKPFLIDGAEASTPVTDSQLAKTWFARLRSVCGQSSQSVIGVLEEMCDQRREFDIQRRVHRWLHAWLPIHIGLSLAVTVMLAAHVWTALKYW